MNKIKTVTIGILCVFLFGCLMTGCGADPTASEQSATPATATSTQPESTPEDTQQITPEATPASESTTPTPSYRAIGTQDAQAFSVILTNSTGKDITGISIKSSGEKKYPSSIVSKNEPVAQGETIQLFYTPANTQDDESIKTNPNDKDTAVAMSVAYDIRLTVADKSVLELYDFGFQDIEEAELCLEDGVVFVKYMSKSTGESVSTKNAQIAAKEKQEQDAKKSDEAKKSATPKKSASPKKSNSSKKSSNKDKKKSTPKPSQSADECLDDDIDWN